MKIKSKQIISETPKNEIWSYFSKFGYEANVKKYLLQKNKEGSFDETLVSKVTGSIQQSISYFEQAEKASPYIKPLLLYYGSTNLYYAVSILLKGGPVIIEGHGMDVIDHTLGTEIGLINVRSTDKATGGLKVYSEILSESSYELKSNEWSMCEILSGIPDLVHLCEETYSDSRPYCIPLQEIKTKRYSHFRFRNDDVSRFGNEDFISRIHLYGDNFLRAEGQNDFCILKKKISFKGNCFTKSVSGQKYLQILHNKKGVNIHVSILQRYLLGLFTLGRICRYNPDIWFQFIKRDETGEKHLVEKFMELSSRQMPHLLYEKLIGEEVTFIFEGQNDLDLTDRYSEAEMKEFIKEQVREFMIRKN